MLLYSQDCKAGINLVLPFLKKLNDNPLPLTRFGSIEALLFRLVSLQLNSFSRIVEDLTLNNSPARGK